MPTVAALLTAGGTAAAGFALTPWGRGLVGRDSGWLRRGTPALLAGLGGLGAASLADSYVELVAFGVLAVASALLVVVDLACLRLPDVIIAPTYAVLFGLLAVAAAVGGDWGRLGRASAVAGLLLAGYFVLAILAPSDLGLGDVKLAGVLGGFLGWLGWSQALLGVFAAFALGGVVALLLIIFVRADRRRAFAFGPCMVGGAVLGAGWGPTLLNLG